jgi:ABC-type Fe2+-enterobactin transport system substrate-binding protein
MPAVRNRQRASGIYPCSTVVITVESEGEIQMIAKILSGALLAGYMLAVSAPIVAVAADAPKTKADCKKAKDMKWDKTTKTCVKK